MDDTITGEPVVEIPGAILLSSFIQSFLLGVIITQAIKYWADYRDDSLRKRLFVAAVILVSVVQTALEDYKTWRTTIHQISWSTSPIQWSDLFLNGVLLSLCEGFFIRRCWKMTNKSPWVLYPLSALSSTVTAANIYLAIAMGIAFRSVGIGATNDQLYASRKILISTVVAFSYWIFGTLVLNTIVTSILVISLWRSKTGLNEPDRVIVHIIVITLESAALPFICMLAAVALYHASPHLKDHLVLFFILFTGKLYTVGLLRTLNSRVKLRERMKSHDLGRTSLGDWQWDQWQEPSGAVSGVSEPPSQPLKAIDTTAIIRRPPFIPAVPGGSTRFPIKITPGPLPITRISSPRRQLTPEGQRSWETTLRPVSD